jgi:BASS family bile acid:Na+ symporter
MGLTFHLTKKSMENIDAVRLNFVADSLDIMNLTLSFIMFGVALDLQLEDFKRLYTIPKLMLVGLASQLIFLPAVTLGLVYLINPIPSFALGMFILAACPGGNVSNFMSSLAKGNVALSVSLTAFVTVSSIVVMPFSFQFWSSLYAPSAELLREVHLDYLEVGQTILFILGVPIILGMLFARKFPKTTEKIKKPLKMISVLTFASYVGIAFVSNFDYFLQYVKYVVLIVFIHNTSAILTGYSLSSLFGITGSDRRTISIETGIQNSGIALILIFNFFDGLGGMALVAGWWSVWHLTAGLGLSTFWSYRPPASTKKEPIEG